MTNSDHTKSSEDHEPGELLMGVRAIAAYMNIGEKQVARLYKLGLIPHFRLGNSLSSTKSSLKRWLDEMGMKGFAEADRVYQEAQKARQANIPNEATIALAAARATLRARKLARNIGGKAQK